MPTNSPNQGIPLPVDGDDPNIPEDMATMALFLEKQIIGIYANTTDLATRATSPKHGQMAFVRADNSLYYCNAALAWTKMFIPITQQPVITVSTSAPSGGSNGDVHYRV